ncbi:MAG: fibronectin type III domain-containing protein [Oscillospiraceae bacterium]|nr:fibronectin type III domain-containing protein [Oscillospiraceae bacterium]
MKKILSIILAGLMLISCMSLNLFADEEQAKLSCTNGDGRVILSWEDTDDESYDVYWKRYSSDEWKLAGTVTGHKVNVIGLKNGISYQFKVEIGGEFSETVYGFPFVDPYPYIASVLSEIDFEQPYSAAELAESEKAYVVETNATEECAVEGNSIMQNENDIEALLEMYCALPEIIEPTDEEIARDTTRGITFFVDGVKHYLTVDENNIITWDGADGYFKFTDPDIDYFTTLGNFDRGYNVETRTK